jgi:hypothetical protein
MRGQYICMSCRHLTKSCQWKIMKILGSSHISSAAWRLHFSPQNITFSLLAQCTDMSWIVLPLKPPGTSTYTIMESSVIPCYRLVVYTTRYNTVLYCLYRNCSISVDKRYFFVHVQNEKYKTWHCPLPWIKQ